MTSTRTSATWAGIGLILLTGIIHASMVGEEFEEAHYLGVLFVGASIGSVIAAAGIYRQQLLWGWATGALIAFGSIAGYLLSRTVGLPIAGIEPWGPAAGYTSLAAEILFLALTTRVVEVHEMATSIR